MERTLFFSFIVSGARGNEEHIHRRYSGESRRLTKLSQAAPDTAKCDVIRRKRRTVPKRNPGGSTDTGKLRANARSQYCVSAEFFQRGKGAVNAGVVQMQGEGIELMEE